MSELSISFIHVLIMFSIGDAGKKWVTTVCSGLYPLAWVGSGLVLILALQICYRRVVERWCLLGATEREICLGMR